MIELVTPVLTVVVGWLIRQALRVLKVEINVELFNTLVAAIVTYLLALAGIEGAVRAGLLA